ncbi:protein-L-isoaspartate(D-aspartate) O-methyltransferase [Hahella chejuensis]|nr:protein-L-isoaspartate(D-aspartate) O-methyltransferase [Hahella chejuensis]
MNFDLQGIGMTSRRTRLRLIERLRKNGIQNEAVLEAMTEIPRHIFVDEALAHRAYEDTALPIGHSQTISQPYIVARMTELLCSGWKPKRVLEVGAGSGYQTAILARLSTQVYTVERIAPLLEKAKLRFKALKLNNVSAKLSDGRWGWPEQGPFDAIMVTAAPEQTPSELLEQLADGGRLVIPVGSGSEQMLKVYKRQGAEIEESSLEQVRFVPLLGGVVR